MTTSYPWQKKERALGILTTASTGEEPAEAVAAPNALRELFYRPEPALIPGPWLTVLFALILPIACFAYVRFSRVFDTSTVSAYDLSPLVLVALLTIFLWHQASLLLEKRNVRKLAYSLVAPYEELRAAHEYIDGYLADLDERTRKYFHCVTNTKVMAYFILVQINHALFDRLGELDALFSEPSSENYIAAFHLLRSELVLKNSVLGHTSEIQLLHSRRARLAIDLLVEDLEKGLGALEEEISRSKDFSVDEY